MARRERLHHHTAVYTVNMVCMFANRCALTFDVSGKHLCFVWNIATDELDSSLTSLHFRASSELLAPLMGMIPPKPSNMQAAAEPAVHLLLE